jgi:hypothetical protein
LHPQDPFLCNFWRCGAEITAFAGVNEAVKLVLGLAGAIDKTVFDGLAACAFKGSVFALDALALWWGVWAHGLGSWVICNELVTSAALLEIPFDS